MTLESSGDVLRADIESAMFKLDCATKAGNYQFARKMVNKLYELHYKGYADTLRYIDELNKRVTQLKDSPLKTIISSHLKVSVESANKQAEVLNNLVLI